MCKVFSVSMQRDIRSRSKKSMCNKQITVDKDTIKTAS